MDTLQRTVQILADSEAALAALAAETAKEASYDAAACLIDLAKDVADLASKARAHLGPTRAESGHDSHDVRSTSLMLSPPARPSGRGRPRRAEYPKFLREGSNLVKLGWSPSQKSEYEHKSPKKTIPLLLAAISKMGSNGRRFSMDKVLPLVDPTEGRQVPDYQAYLCLAWLKTLGFLTQHGRQGYSFKSRPPLEPLIEQHWASLPPR